MVSPLGHGLQALLGVCSFAPSPPSSAHEYRLSPRWSRRLKRSPKPKKPSSVGDSKAAEKARGRAPVAWLSTRSVEARSDNFCTTSFESVSSTVCASIERTAVTDGVSRHLSSFFPKLK